MNKFSLFFIGVMWTATLSAQTVTVKKQSDKVRNETAEGFETTLEGKRDDVSTAWAKFLKDYGKGKSSGDMITITEPALGGTVYSKGVLYAVTSGNDTKVKVWMGIIGSEWMVNDIEIVNKEIEQLVYRFGVKFYRDKIQVQIDQSQQAADAVDRQAQRLVNENRTLNTRLKNNEEQKIQLEKSLQENRLDNLVLIQKLENNKKAQDSVAQATVQIKRVVETHKERQRKVN